MNIVFWLLVALAGVAVWLLLYPLFTKIGGSAVSTYTKVKNKMTQDNNRKENIENE